MDSKSMQLLTIYFTDGDIATNVIKNVFKNGFDDNNFTDNDFHSFTWELENKYFSADISVCCCPEKLFNEVKFDELNQMEAVLMIADLNDASTVEKVKSILPIIEERDAEICLLYSFEDIHDADSKDDIFAFCIDNHFELIENIECIDNDEVSAFEEKFGVDRVIEALNSHVWNGNVMKSGHNLVKDISHQNLDFNEISDSDASFQELFGKFLLMKETAKSLGEEERKAYAEKVSLAFMDALGIDDGDSDDTEEDESHGKNVDNEEPLR